MPLPMPILIIIVMLPLPLLNRRLHALRLQVIQELLDAKATKTPAFVKVGIMAVFLLWRLEAGAADDRWLFARVLAEQAEIVDVFALPAGGLDTAYRCC